MTPHNPAASLSPHGLIQRDGTLSTPVPGSGPSGLSDYALSPLGMSAALLRDEVRVAFLARTSTEDLQDPRQSILRQLGNCKSAVPESWGGVVDEPAERSLDVRIDDLSPTDFERPAWFYGQRQKRGEDRTYTGYVNYLHGEEAERLRGELATILLGLLRWFAHGSPRNGSQATTKAGT